MQIDVKEIYNHAFAAQRHASDFRAKIIAGWSVMHTAIATVFVWVQANQRSLAWVVLYAGAIMTLQRWRFRAIKLAISFFDSPQKERRSQRHQSLSANSKTCCCHNPGCNLSLIARFDIL